MCDSWNVLIVSSHLENRRALVRILDCLPVNVTVSCALFQAQEVLAGREIHIVFCDDSLPAGTYRDLLSMRSIAKPCVVVMTQTAEPGYRYETIVQGAFDVLRCPLESTDVELIVIRAARHLLGQNESQVSWRGSSRMKTKPSIVSIRA
jgi:DNA-binding NtrC family response regulator